MWPWKAILITGGSSGLGQAMALELAAPGVFLAITGRDKARLDGVADACKMKGAAVGAFQIDAANFAAMADLIAEIEAEMPLDLVIANAGVSAGTGGGDETDDQIAEILAANVDGVIATVRPALAAMALRGRGQIAIMSSLASFRGFGGAPTYCASKAFVRVWGEALRADWRPRGLKINVICPGFVRSRMTAKNNFKMPFLMDADRAARIMLRGLAADKPRIAYPWPTYWATRFIAGLPQFLTDMLMARLPKKG